MTRHIKGVTPAPKKASAAKKVELPPDVVAADLKYPEYGDSVKLPDGLYGALTFYLVKGRRVNDWVLTTLHISNGKNGRDDRSYGIEVASSKVCRVGNGPHVFNHVKVYVSKKNIDRLQKYVDLWVKGMADAGAIRDRISTRRAQGQLYRAQGRTSWMW